MKRSPPARRRILILTPTFAPDVGGVETHLSDLVAALSKRHQVTVLTHKPIVTSGIGRYLPREVGPSFEIRRYWWFGGNLFRRLEAFPPLLFLYMTPYLALRAFLFLLARSRDIDLLHVHGLNSAFAGLLLGRLFRKPVVMQTHALYAFRPGSPFARFAAFVLRRMGRILTLCEASTRELVSIGVPPGLISPYRYWIDLARFSAPPKAKAKKLLGWEDAFTCFFVARLMRMKGTEVVTALARRFPRIRFIVAGSGPDGDELAREAAKLPNLRLLGLVPNLELHRYFAAADLALVPSLYPEGFGRVICESLACGTPVIASRLGGIPDAMDESVGRLCAPEAAAFGSALALLLRDKRLYERLRRAARPFAMKRFSASNAEAMEAAYEAVMARKP